MATGNRRNGSFWGVIDAGLHLVVIHHQTAYLSFKYVSVYYRSVFLLVLA